MVHRIQLGDETAFATLFQDYAPALAAFVHGYVHDDAVAEELVQDVFLWMLRNRATWSVRGTIRSYLYGAARHAALDYLKHRAVERRWASRGVSFEDSAESPDPTARLIEDERVAQLAQAIGQLPESRRTALSLRWMQGLSYAEIAAVLGSSPKAVENQLNRTLHQLRRLLGVE